MFVKFCLAINVLTCLMTWVHLAMLFNPLGEWEEHQTACPCSATDTSLLSAVATLSFQLLLLLHYWSNYAVIMNLFTVSFWKFGIVRFFTVYLLYRRKSSKDVSSLKFPRHPLSIQGHPFYGQISNKVEQPQYTQ